MMRIQKVLSPWSCSGVNEAMKPKRGRFYLHEIAVEWTRWMHLPWSCIGMHITSIWSLWSCRVTDEVTSWSYLFEVAMEHITQLTFSTSLKAKKKNNWRNIAAPDEIGHPFSLCSIIVPQQWVKNDNRAKRGNCDNHFLIIMKKKKSKKYKSSQLQN